LASALKLNFENFFESNWIIRYLILLYLLNLLGFSLHILTSQKFFVGGLMFNSRFFLIINTLLHVDSSDYGLPDFIKILRTFRSTYERLRMLSSRLYLDLKPISVAAKSMLAQRNAWIGRTLRVASYAGAAGVGRLGFILKYYRIQKGLRTFERLRRVEELMERLVKRLFELPRIDCPAKLLINIRLIILMQKLQKF
jgi:hypothetical protein